MNKIMLFLCVLLMFLLLLLLYAWLTLLETKSSVSGTEMVSVVENVLFSVSLPPVVIRFVRGVAGADVSLQLPEIAPSLIILSIATDKKITHKINQTRFVESQVQFYSPGARCAIKTCRRSSVSSVLLARRWRSNRWLNIYL